MTLGIWPALLQPAQPQRILRRLRFIAWLAAVCIGFVQVWALRFWLSPDGNTYLDVATAYLRGDWKNAVNAYWSPLFSWLLALGIAIVHPGVYWESTLLHLMNFAAFLLSLLSFEFFFRNFLKARKRLAWAADENQEPSELAWWLLGYGLFFSTSVFVLSLGITTPDIWVAVWTFLIAGIILRIATSGGGFSLFAALGCALGVAYLTKSFYFPMAFLFLPTAWLASGDAKKNFKPAVAGFAIFLLVAGPWVLVLSRAKQRFTFGDVGKLAFVMTVDRVQQPFFWQGENATGTPRHPTRQLLSNPRLYEFAAPVAGTYPPAYDLSYWMEGARPHFDLAGLLIVLRQSVGSIFKFLTDQIEYLVALFFLVFLAGASSCLPRLRRQWFLWLPPLLACVAYSLVLIEGRYIAPFLLLLWLAAFSLAVSSASLLTSRNALALVLAIVSVTALRVTKFTADNLMIAAGKQENIDYNVARGLQALGIAPGDRAATLARMAEVHWARMAEIKIVAEIPLGEESAFWNASPPEKLNVFRVLAGTGAKILIAKDPPAFATREGWTPVGGTGFYVHRLTPMAAAGAPEDRSH